MFNSSDFFKKRFSSHMKELSRYLRYIFNGHLIIVMLFLVSALAVYYQQWLMQIPENFPGPFIISIVFAFVISYSPVRTLLKEPDLYFLIVAEDRMNAYFRNTLVYSFVIQLYLVFLAAAVMGPLYFAVFPDRTGRIYLLTLIIIFILKFANLIANWWMLKVRDRSIRTVDLTARSFLNLVLMYFLVRGEMLFAALVTLLFVSIFLYDYRLSKRQLGIQWELLLEKDQSRMQSFYRVANMFAEVPQVKSKVKERKWLVSLLTKGIPFHNEKTYDYLYRITFVRSSDYIGMYLRLLILGGVCILFVPNMWVRVVFSVLFVYLSCFQMMSLYQHHRLILWIDLYPVENHFRKNALVKLLYQLSVLQIIIYGGIFLFMHDVRGAVIALAACSVFILLFMNGYVKRKLAM